LKRKILLTFNLWFILLPNPLPAQELAREALACFPNDTQQIAYVNLDQLRALPNYHQLRRAIFSLQMQNFEEFLRSLGTDPEKDVNEIVVGWRGPVNDLSALFGIAQGQFRPDQAQSYIAREKLPFRQYEGFTLDAFGSGLGRDDTFFTFLSSDLAAFGRLSDLEAVVDGYLGNRVVLNSNSQFVNWEAELEGSGPQWGITTGRAAANLAVPLLLGESNQKIDLSSLLSPIRAVLYQVHWDTDFSTQIAVICQDAQSAGTLSQLLNLWRVAVSKTNSKPADVTQFIQRLEIQTDGNRIELEGSGPPDILSRLLHGTGP